MSLLVLGYPTISKVDWEWIQAIRAEHDRLYYHIVDPHFTIVFPVHDVEPQAFAEHILRQTADVRKVSFVLRCATVVKDAFSEHTHTFLVPDEGHGAIVKLHDRLYRDVLQPHLLLDIPFIPHIGVGNSVDPQVCKKRADDLNQHNLSIEGTIETLDVVRYEGEVIETMERIKLL
jgi:hypothetical protein